jgi:hypothetical protein
MGLSFLMDEAETTNYQGCVLIAQRFLN